MIGADPRRSDFGTIVDRVDMPNVGDELHHYGYSHDRKRLLVPGLFSSGQEVLDDFRCQPPSSLTPTSLSRR